MNIEIELRYEIVSLPVISDFLQKYKFLGQKSIIDCYLDTPEGELRRKGLFVRVRNHRKIDVKFNRACLYDNTLELQPDCEEHSFVLPIVGEELLRFNALHHELGLAGVQNFSLEEYKKANNFVDHRVVDKIRSTYEADSFILVLDEIKDLGFFLEIELMAQSGCELQAIDDVAVAMKKFLEGLPLKPLKTGYESLVLRKRNFEQYLQGRFILDEDKKFLQHGSP